VFGTRNKSRNLVESKVMGRILQNSRAVRTCDGKTVLGGVLRAHRSNHFGCGGDGLPANSQSRYSRGGHGTRETKVSERAICLKRNFDLIGRSVCKVSQHRKREPM